MLLPALWLHDYCDPGLDAKALEDRLTMTGTKVERLFAHGVGEGAQLVAHLVELALLLGNLEQGTRVDLGDLLHQLN